MTLYAHVRVLVCDMPAIRDVIGGWAADLQVSIPASDFQLAGVGGACRNGLQNVKICAGQAWLGVETVPFGDPLL